MTILMNKGSWTITLSIYEHFPFIITAEFALRRTSTSFLSILVLSIITLLVPFNFSIATLALALIPTRFCKERTKKTLWIEWSKKPLNDPRNESPPS
jgi:hypothetical protein